MNNTIIENKLSNLKSEKLDWEMIRTDMKNKLGMDIYESWLKKIVFVEEFHNYVLLSFRKYSLTKKFFMYQNL